MDRFAAGAPHFRDNSQDFQLGRHDDFGLDHFNNIAGTKLSENRHVCRSRKRMKEDHSLLSLSIHDVKPVDNSDRPANDKAVLICSNRRISGKGVMQCRSEDCQACYSNQHGPLHDDFMDDADFQTCEVDKNVISPQMPNDLSSESGHIVDDRRAVDVNANFSAFQTEKFHVTQSAIKNTVSGKITACNHTDKHKRTSENGQNHFIRKHSLFDHDGNVQSVSTTSLHYPQEIRLKINKCDSSDKNCIIGDAPSAVSNNNFHSQCVNGAPDNQHKSCNYHSRGSPVKPDHINDYGCGVWKDNAYCGLNNKEAVSTGIVKSLMVSEKEAFVRVVADDDLIGFTANIADESKTPPLSTAFCLPSAFADDFDTDPYSDSVFHIGPSVSMPDASSESGEHSLLNSVPTHCAESLSHIEMSSLDVILTENSFDNTMENIGDAHIVGPSSRRKRRKKRRNSKQCRHMPKEMLDDPELQKYWHQQYRLFSRFDQGIRLDRGQPVFHLVYTTCSVWML